MQRDLRDPQKMGEALLELRRVAAPASGIPVPLSKFVDDNAVLLSMVPAYDANLGPVEKYGAADAVEPRYELIKVA